jgi:ATP-dependent DNA helicase RecQ
VNVCHNSILSNNIYSVLSFAIPVRENQSKYAHEFLPIICAYCKDRNIPEKQHLADRRNRRKAAVSPRTVAITEAFNSGDSLQTIASDFSIKERTVIGNLWKHVQAGGNLDSSGLINLSGLDSLDRRRVLDAMADLGVDRLRPIYDYLDETVSYNELWIMRLYFVAAGLDKSRPT